MDKHTMRRARSSVMASGILLLALLALAGCVGMSRAIPSATQRPLLTPGANKPEVDLSATAFLQEKITIKRTNGSANLNFVDLSDGGPHILCVGWDGQCTKHAQGPVVLTTFGGMTIDAGQVRTVTFTSAGTYRITCPLHPGMNLTVTVQ